MSSQRGVGRAEVDSKNLLALLKFAGTLKNNAMRSPILERAKLSEARGVLREDEGVGGALVRDGARQRGATEATLALAPLKPLCDLGALRTSVAREA